MLLPINPEDNPCLSHGKWWLPMQIEAVAESGCPSCKVVVAALEHFNSSSTSNSNSDSGSDFEADNITFVLFGKNKISIRDVEDEDFTIDIDFYVKDSAASTVLGNEDGLFASLPTRRQIESDPSGPLGLESISSWAQTCTSTHASCPSPPCLLPTRVIDVSAPDGSINLRVSPQQPGHYIALSHCWGLLPIMTTTTANLRQHTKNIALSSLPKTFRDAVQIARHLGIPYLWIDSLCIIQDSESDWAYESAKMASIYRSAYLTIAATGAKDGSEGLFKEREAEELAIAVPGGDTNIYARLGRRHDKLMRGNLIAGSCDPLIGRAWVYQERLLSSKVLHFGSQEMVWLCEGARACECGLLPSSDDGGRSLFGLLLPSSPTEVSGFKAGEKVESDSPVVTGETWHRMIKDYTMLLITKSLDRLPAFSGIASVLIAPENYLAGLRRDHIARDLLWASYGETRRPDTYLAPSWSWASIEGPIYYPIYSDRLDDVNEILFTVQDVGTQLSTVDPFGRVSGGSLRLRGPCVDVAISSTRKRGILPIVNPADREQEWGDFLSDAADEDGVDAVSPWAGQEACVLGTNLTKDRITYLVLVKQTESPLTYRRIGRGSMDIKAEGGRNPLVRCLGTRSAERQRELVVL